MSNLRHVVLQQTILTITYWWNHLLSNGGNLFILLCRINALLPLFRQQVTTANPQRIILRLKNSIKLVRTAWVLENPWLRKRYFKTWKSDSPTATSPASRAGARLTPNPVACNLAWVEPHEDEHFVETKWLDDDDGQVHDDKAPIAQGRLRHSECFSIRSNSNERVLYDSKKLINITLRWRKCGRGVWTGLWSGDNHWLLGVD